MGKAFRGKARGGGDMRRVLRCVGLALVLAVLPVAFAQDKKPDDKAMPADKNAPKTEKEALNKMHVGGEITGKLIQWGNSEKGFTVQVPITYYTLNEGEARAAAQAQINLAKAKTVQDAINAKNDMLYHQARIYSPQKKDVNIDFTPAAEMKVRTLHPMVYDDKGKPKKLSRKELDELKGPDKKLPGYTADIGDVKQEMVVTVYIEKKKATKAKDKDEKALTDLKPEALMVVIVADVPQK
jgi:hypothetical protein